MASNEELAVLIQNGATEYIPRLWEQVRRYVEMRARRYAANMPIRWADADDLTQAGYFAMLAAVRDYEPGRGASFLTCLTWALQKEFAAVAGVRSSRRDAARYTDSMDAPLSDEVEDITQYDILADSRAQEPFLAIEEGDYTLAVHDTILTALNGLCDERKRRLIIGMYFEGRTLTEASELAGYHCNQIGNWAHQWVLRTLRHCSYTRSLRELLHGFGEVDPYADGLQGVGVGRWRATGESATERVAVKLIESEDGQYAPRDFGTSGGVDHTRQRRGILKKAPTVENVGGGEPGVSGNQSGDGKIAGVGRL